MVSLLKKGFVKRVAFAFLVPFLLAGLSFISCSNPTGSDVTVPATLVGTWSSSGGGDEYTIKGTNLSYNSGYGEDYDFSGTIKFIKQFTDTSGVIIIQYDKGHEQKYFGIPSTNGKFCGIYYDSLEPGVSVEMAAAYWSGGAEQPTINAAKTAYTEEMGVASHAVDITYVYDYGTYVWQP